MAMSGEGGPLPALGHMPFHGHRTAAAVAERWCAECKQLRAAPCRYSLCALAEPDAAHVADHRPVAVLRWSEDGDLQLGMFGAGCRMLVVDERCPHDRIYEVTQRAPLEAIDAIIPPGSEIGHAGDERHTALVERMTALFEGRPHLVAVPSGGAA